VSLRDVQGLFHRLVTAPENVERTMMTLGVPADEVQSAFKGDATLPPVARLDIYADMYFFRIRDVLKDVYERVLGEVGEEAFHNLIVDYLIVRPPRTPSIRDAGDRLPEFLKTHALTEEHPWLPELALLEWWRLDVFDAEDVELLDLETLRATPPEAFGDVPLALVPAHRFIGAAWSVEDADPKQPSAGTVLVWRNGFDADHRRLEPLEAAALRLASKGTTFGDVCELIARQTSEGEAPSVAFGYLTRWIGDDLLARR
jgi:hypothetical protein